jgi:hypothetical protein
MFTLSRRRLFPLLSAAALPAAGAGPNDFTFALIGDRTGSARPQIYSRVFREVLLADPAFAVTIGDAIEGVDDAKAPAQWAEMEALWGTAPFPIRHTPGNHDIWNDASAAAFARHAGHPPQYAWVHQNTLFVILDNSRTEGLAPAQLAFLEQSLQAHAGCHPKMVFLHKPFWIPQVAVGSGEFALHQMAKKHGVTHVFSGHGHQFVHLETGGIHYTEIGSSGGNIDRGLSRGEGFRQGWFYHYFLIRVAGGQVRVTVRELPPPYGLGRAFRLEEWNAGGPQFDPGDPALAARPRL